jgi:hypothetical protein
MAAKMELAGGTGCARIEKKEFERRHEMYDTPRRYVYPDELWQNERNRLC